MGNGREGMGGWGEGEGGGGGGVLHLPHATALQSPQQLRTYLVQLNNYMLHT